MPGGKAWMQEPHVKGAHPEQLATRTGPWGSTGFALLEEDATIANWVDPVKSSWIGSHPS